MLNREISKEREIAGKDDLSLWAEDNLILDGECFSFRGHEYLRDIYRDPHEYVVIEKASQMGASVMALAKAIWACRSRGMKVIYFFPTNDDVMDFSRDRFSKLLGESPELQKIFEDDKSLPAQSIHRVNLKRIGQGTLYFRGLFYSARSRQGRTGTGTKSVDADFLIFDELDEAQPKQKEAAIHRIDHSRWKWILELSTPTIPDYGIDVEFQKSDGRYWMLKCGHCGEWNCVEDEFPRCLLRTDTENVILACRKCRLKLDPSKGEWVARRPHMKKRRGYHICQLYSTFVDLNDILNEYENPKTDRTLFFNHRLGLPHINTDDRISKENVLDCCSSDIVLTGRAGRCWMGVDQGKKLHVFISTGHTSGKIMAVLLKTVDEFEDLDRLMLQYNVETCVIDALPNQHSARKFGERHRGRVYLCYYNENPKQACKWSNDNNEGGRVEINRTDSLNETFRQILEKEILLPPVNRDIEEFADHCHALVRTKIEDSDTGQIRFRYMRMGDDHYAHARNYCRVAESTRGAHSFGAITTGKRTDWRRMTDA